MRLTGCAAGTCLLLWTLPAHAHHGVAAISVAGPEGPGAAVETTSPLPLPVGMGFAMLKSETVRFQKFTYAEPTNKDESVFNMLGLGYGLRPWFAVYLFQPFNVKCQEDAGCNAGLGDTSLMLSLGFKYDEGLRLVPEKESLDELFDWHFSVWLAPTFPLGPTERKDRQGNPFSPDMQTGFGSPSAAVGVAVMKQLSDDFTWLADSTYHYFLPHSYSWTRYQFGPEARVDTALGVRVVGRRAFRADVIAELGGLNLWRDRARDSSGVMQPQSASGGAILYSSLGMRFFFGPFSAALGIKRAVLKDLNEGYNQQGSEGLEAFRATATLSYARKI